MALELHRFSVINSLMTSTDLLSVWLLFPSGHGAGYICQTALSAWLPPEVLSAVLTTGVFHEVSTRTLAKAALQTRNSETLITDAIQERRTGWRRGEHTAVPNQQKLPRQLKRAADSSQRSWQVGKAISPFNSRPKPRSAHFLSHPTALIWFKSAPALRRSK